MGLSWETFEIILALRRSGKPFAMKPTELYRATLLTSGAMTNRLDKAEVAGLILRERDPNDRRGVIVQLTPQGLAVAESAVDLYFNEMGAVLDNLELAQKQRLAESLTDLLGMLERKETDR